MHNFKYLKTIFFAFPLMVIGSGKAWAGLPLPMAMSDCNLFEALPITETREFLLTGDSIMLIGFLLWIAYIVFFFPKETFKKL